uniref:Uncharacterized protein n=1 Tax=Magnetococcus massalia (strain MO-1) TaxID=451514 RepID=A0A1S7LGL7_MAGMO|nr:protein of unknown function [Candidatus Magnetococcus massalia]
MATPALAQEPEVAKSGAEPTPSDTLQELLQLQSKPKAPPKPVKLPDWLPETLSILEGEQFALQEVMAVMQGQLEGQGSLQAEQLAKINQSMSKLTQQMGRVADLSGGDIESNQALAVHVKRVSLQLEHLAKQLLKLEQRAIISESSESKHNRAIKAVGKRIDGMESRLQDRDSQLAQRMRTILWLFAGIMLIMVGLYGALYWMRRESNRTLQAQFTKLVSKNPPLDPDTKPACDPDVKELIDTLHDLSQDKKS